MEHTERISVERGMAAYQRTQIVPKPANWDHCGGGVFLLDEGVDVKKVRLSGAFRQRFGDDYLLGFTNAFDGTALKGVQHRSRYIQGHADGKRLREAVKPWMDAGMPLPAEGVAVESGTENHELGHLVGVAH